MPRASNGTYTLPAGNPVVADTDILASWANNTLDDIADALTDSLSRTGQGGMSVPLEFADGSAAAPGITWENETSTGLYRAGSNDMRLAVAGVDKMRWTASEVAEFYISSVWTSIEDIAGSTAIPIETRAIDYTFVLDDAQTLQILTGSTGRTWLIPTNASVTYDAGTVIAVAAADSGELTLDPDSGVTLTSPIAQGSTTSRIVVAGGQAVLTYIGSDEWLLTGDIR